MSESVSFGQIDLGYPPWCLDFDSFNRGYLIVGGGGGEGQKEVPNRLTLLDVSKRSHIEKVAEHDLVNDDSVVSVGGLCTKDGLIVLSGINSARAERERSGENQHLRSFKVVYPTRATGEKVEKREASITPIARIMLFSPASASEECYQRLLRLSPAKRSATANKRIGAIANSLAPASEIVVFDATAAIPMHTDVIQRVYPKLNAEVNDLDIMESEDGGFLLAYATKNEVYITPRILYDFDTRTRKKAAAEAYCLYSAPSPDPAAHGRRAHYRGLRFLTPDHLVLLAFTGKQSELQILRVYSGAGGGEIILRKRLPKDLGHCISMDLTLLDKDTTTGAFQAVIAVAAQAYDIIVLTIDYLGKTKNSVDAFRTYKQLSRVHKTSMKKVVLSQFHSPWPQTADDESSTSENSKKNMKKVPGQQYLRLASISLSNTLCIDDLPLHPLDSKKRNSRHVLSRANRLSSALQTNGSILALSFMLLIGLLLFQSLYSNTTTTTTGPTSTLKLLPESWQSLISAYRDRAGQMSDMTSNRVRKVIQEPIIHSQAGKRILDILHVHHSENAHLPDLQKQAVIIRAPPPAPPPSDASQSSTTKSDGEEQEGDSNPQMQEGLSTEIHADAAELIKADAQARKWEDLSEKQQKLWKKRLVDAGQWSAEYGETLLKGVFFSEVAGAVGRAAAQALGG